MPTYDYRCASCGHEFELFQQMSDPVKRKCPKCGKAKLERLIGTGSGVIFKGGGFYQTDYRSDSYKKAADAEKKSHEKPATDATSASASESKPKEPKTESNPQAPSEKKSARSRKRPKDS